MPALPACLPGAPFPARLALPSCETLRDHAPERSPLPPPTGVDFKAKLVEVNGEQVKLSIWDTAGQERFRTLTSSYYRGAQGVILVYDVTRRETFEALEEVWLREVGVYSTVPDAVKMVVANKTDLAGAREVSRANGIALARRAGALFVETSAKGNVAVDQAFEELVLKIMETPSLLGTTPPQQTGGLRPRTAAGLPSCCA